MNKILFIRSSAFKTTRVIRQVEELVNAGNEVSILHWERMIDKEHNDNVIFSLNFNAKVFSFNKKCNYGKGIFSLIPRVMWFLYIIKLIFELKPDIVHAVDFDSSFPAYLASKIIKIKLVYDIADFIETFDSNIPMIIRKFISYLSGKVVKASSLIILPDKNRISNIEKVYQEKITLVNNAPNIDLLSLPIFEFTEEQEVSLNNAVLNVFYYGAFNEDRAIRLLLEAAKADRLEGVNFWFAGWGALEHDVSSSNTVNVHYLGRLKQLDAIALLKNMDCSLIYYDPSYEHNRLASPNKIFEAMAVGVPVIVARNTSIDKLVEEKNIGYVGNYTTNDLVDIIANINIEDKKKKKENILSLYSEYSWEKSAKNLRESYAKL